MHFSGFLWYHVKKAKWESADQREFEDFGDVNAEHLACEVDYVIVKSRLDDLARLVAKKLAKYESSDSTGDSDSFDHRCYRELIKLPRPELRKKADAAGMFGEKTETPDSIVPPELSGGAGILGGGVGSPFIFDLLTREEDSGQELESATLELVRADPLLAEPNGVRLTGIDADTKSGIMSLKTLKQPSARCHRGARLAPITAVELQAGSSGVAAMRALPAECQVQHKNFVLAALQQHGMALEHVVAEMQNDWEVVLAAVQQTGWALAFLSAELQNDREVVLAAVQRDGYTLKHASAALQNDPAVRRAAGRV